MKRAEIEKQFKNAGISKIDTDIQNIKLKALKKEARDPIKFEAELKYVVLEKMGERLKELEEIVYLPKNFWKYTATI